MYPDNLQYSPEHHWVALADDTARIGVSQFAQQQMGDLVYFELPEVGDQVTAGQSYGSMESVKAVSDLNAPLTGEVVEINAALDDAPQLVNRDPYGAGWTINIRVADVAEVSRLLNAADYQKLTEEVAAKRKPKAG